MIEKGRRQELKGWDEHDWLWSLLVELSLYDGYIYSYLGSPRIDFLVLSVNIARVKIYDKA